MRLHALTHARAINVRCTAPGHASPHFLARAHVLDPTHPAASLALRSLPSFVCPQLTVRAFPNAVLQEPVDFVPLNPLLATGQVRASLPAKHPPRWWSNLALQPVRVVPNPGKPSTWTTHDDKEGPRRWHNRDAMRRHIKYLLARQLADARTAALAQRGRHNVGLLFHMSKKATSKSCVVRRRLRSKITAAINLVVSRNADAVDAPAPQRPAPYPPLTLISRSLHEGERIVLQGWTYLVVPDLAVYKMPMPNLVQVVRKALLSLRQQSERLESSWSAQPKNKTPLHESKSRTWTSHPRHAQGSDPPREPPISSRLYSRRPVVLSRRHEP